MEPKGVSLAASHLQAWDKMKAALDQKPPGAPAPALAWSCPRVQSSEFFLPDPIGYGRWATLKIAFGIHLLTL